MRKNVWILIISLFINASTMAQETNPIDFWDLEDEPPVAHRLSNEDLIQGVDNKWWYLPLNLSRGVSSRLEMIERRAAQSRQDALMLLTLLSQEIEKESIRGGHLVVLFEGLLRKAQGELQIPNSTLLEVFSHLGWLEDLKQKHTINIQNPFDESLLDFLTTDFSIPSLSLDSPQLETFLHVLTVVHLLYAENPALDFLVEAATLTLQKNKTDSTSKLEELFFKNTLYREALFDSDDVKLTTAGDSALSLRHQLLVHTDMDTQRELASQRIKSFKISCDLSHDYFNILNLEPELQFLARHLNGDWIESLGERLIQMRETLELLKQKPSDSLSTLLLTLSDSSMQIADLQDSYLNRDLEINSQRISNYLKVSRIPDNEKLVKSWTHSVLTICDLALIRDDSEVLNACSNEMVSKLLSYKEGKEKSLTLSQEIDSTVDYLLRQSHGYFLPSHFGGSCQEYDIEKIKDNLIAALEPIIGMSINFPQTKLETAYGVIHSEAIQFEFVDCSQPEYALLNSKRNEARLSQSDSILTRSPSLFFIGSKKLASCIQPESTDSNTAMDLPKYNVEGISDPSLRTISFLTSKKAVLDLVLSELRDGLNPQGEPSLASKEWIELYRGLDKIISQINEIPSALENLVSGSNLPDYLSSFCSSLSSPKNPINCEDQKASVRCKGISLYEVHLAPNSSP